MDIYTKALILKAVMWFLIGTPVAIILYNKIKEL